VPRQSARIPTPRLVVVGSVMRAVVANFPWESPVLRGASASFGLLRPAFLLGQPLALQRLFYGDAAGPSRVAPPASGRRVLGHFGRFPGS
jgi:hypothetical protein